MYPDRDTTSQLLPSCRIQQHEISAWLMTTGLLGKTTNTCWLRPRETVCFVVPKRPSRDHKSKLTAFPRSISVMLYTNYQRRTKSSFSRIYFYYPNLCFQIYAPPYCFSCSTIFILICDERAERFPLQPRSSKVTKLNSLPVLSA